LGERGSRAQCQGEGENRDIADRHGVGSFR